ncbi:branched-chain amino acid transport system ATP-binding protein [Halopolyspora algeriensis]|uniref:Branched-chain amino acid transport system ATP-binding protein n=1 Tax=Halopolyspora algeriensis TaxID=1500506 RepID=A0A368VV40_9ACTN|nr:ABC transporter ATP-binding protein [Halopolyspora algeriensis]RCW45713.1 branched-chain amino acid transport system ATP-binding protein [Halopolyspora algeriensis]TQM54097.1 branched-chain amino acid transport system ATP-binding protein [Halopolyspora algeriensis]
MTETAALEVRDLTASYGPVTALDGVTIRAERGRITAVLGANGAGKTTLLRSVSGLVPTSSGQVLLGDRELTRASAETIARAGIAQVPEGRGVITELTVEENLRLGDLLGTARRRQRHRLEQVYALFPVLAERRRRDAHSLSGGERQMLVIGRALLCAPEVLLLDEPSLGLAPQIVAQIFGVLRELVDHDGMTVLLVEQNARSALSIADAGFVLNLGRVVAGDSAAVLAADDDLRHAYLGF